MIKTHNVILLFLLSSTFVFGQWVQTGSNIVGESTGDKFGRSVSINSDGSIIAVGSFENDDNGLNSGHVRIYENIVGVWTQIGDDINGEAAGDDSGFTIDINNIGNIVAIGARNNDGVNGFNSGHVRLYENIGGVWTQIGDDIDGEAASDQSGQYIDLNNIGNIVAIGATSNDGNGQGSGHVRVYENIGGVWTQIGDDIDGAMPFDLFGRSISLNNDGSIVAIGGNGNNVTGVVRVYENIGGVWTQIGGDIDGEAEGDSFGYSVSINSVGNIIAIGGISADGINNVNSGHVRVFENIGGVWAQIGNDIDGEASSDFFGISVDMDSAGNIVAVGGNNADGVNGINSGHVRVFKNTGGVWTQIGNDIEGEATGDGFGISIDLSANGSDLAIGAWRNDSNGTDSGHVKVYSNAILSVEGNNFEEKISIYPNPTYGISNIALGKIYSNVKLLIFDATGKIITKESLNNINKININTQDFDSGIYIVRIASDNKYADIKIIKR